MPRYIDKSSKEWDAISPEIAILPLGSFEQHGSHLPLGTDIYLVEAIAGIVAERLNAFLLPAQPISTCYEHHGKRGSVHFEAGIFYEIIVKLVERLYGLGFNKVVILPGHGGIFVLEPAVRHINAVHPGKYTVVVDPYDTECLRSETISASTVNDVNEGDSSIGENNIGKQGTASTVNDVNEGDSSIGENNIGKQGTASTVNDVNEGDSSSMVRYVGEDDIHSGDMETSLMLYLKPELVDMAKAVNYIPDKPRPYLNYGSIFTVSPGGVWGNAKQASAEKGKRIFEYSSEATARKILDLFNELT